MQNWLICLAQFADVEDITRLSLCSKWLYNAINCDHFWQRVCTNRGLTMDKSLIFNLFTRIPESTTVFMHTREQIVDFLKVIRMFSTHKRLHINPASTGVLKWNKEQAYNYFDRKRNSIFTWRSYYFVYRKIENLQFDHFDFSRIDSYFVYQCPDVNVWKSLFTFNSFCRFLLHPYVLRWFGFTDIPIEGVSDKLVEIFRMFSNTVGFDVVLTSLIKDQNIIMKTGYHHVLTKWILDTPVTTLDSNSQIESTKLVIRLINKNRSALSPYCRSACIRFSMIQQIHGMKKLISSNSNVVDFLICNISMFANDSQLREYVKYVIKSVSEDFDLMVTHFSSSEVVEDFIGVLMNLPDDHQNLIDQLIAIHNECLISNAKRKRKRYVEIQ